MQRRRGQRPGRGTASTHPRLAPQQAGYRAASSYASCGRPSAGKRSSAMSATTAYVASLLRLYHADRHRNHSPRSVPTRSISSSRTYAPRPTPPLDPTRLSLSPPSSRHRVRRRRRQSAHRRFSPQTTRRGRVKRRIKQRERGKADDRAHPLRLLRDPHPRLHLPSPIR